MSEIISKGQYARLPAFKAMSAADLSVVSKLVKPKNNEGSRINKNRPIDIPDMSVLGRIANKTANSNNDANNLFQVLPEMDLARSILVSAILSPTDMVSTNILYSLLSNKMDDNLTGPMLEVIRTYFDDVYKIKKFLPEMLSDALFMKGSYPLLVMPETSIDYSINNNNKVTFESLDGEVTKDGWFRPYGILGVPEVDGSFKTSMENMWDYRPVSLENLTKERFDVQKKFCAITSPGQTKPLELGGKVYITDNPSILSNPRLMDVLRKQRQSEIYGARSKVNRRVPTGTTVSTEAGVGLKQSPDMSLAAAEKMFYANRQSTPTPMQLVMTPKQLDRENQAHPLVMHLPSECVIPVHVPGDVRNHVGYFVLLDINGNPLSINYTSDYYNDVRASLNGNAEMSTQLLAMARQGTNGSNTAWGTGDIDHMQRAYQQSIETDLLGRLRSGATTGEYELANCAEIFRMMFARSLSSKNTMMLYVPAELMTYITFDYNEFGVGKSLLEDGKILASLRSILLFASTMSAVKNAADTKNINITVPEEDDAPYETVAFMLGEYAKINQNNFPIGETHPSMLVSHLQAAGTVVTVQGNTAFPEAKFEVESREGVHKAVDKELDEDLRRRHIQTFGLTPETMEAASGADFATTVVNQHIMLLKRVIQYQEEFTPFVTDIVRRFTLNSGPLLKELLEVVSTNKDFLDEEYAGKEQQFVLDFVDLLNIELPSPETNRLTDQMAGFDVYTEAVTKAINAYINAESLDPIASQGLEGHLDAIKASLLTMFQRRYMREKNILPELDVFNSLTEEEGPAFNLLTETQQHLDGVLKSTETYIKRMLVEAKKRQKRVLKQQAEVDALTTGGEGGEGDDGFGADTDTLPEGGGDDEFGGDGLDAAVPGDDTGLPAEDGLDGLDDLPAETDTSETAEPVDGEPAAAEEPVEASTMSVDEPLDAEATPDEDIAIDAVPEAAEAEPVEEPVAEEEEEVNLEIPDAPAEETSETEEEPVPDEEEESIVPDELPPDEEEVVEEVPEVEEEEVDLDIPDPLDEEDKDDDKK